MKNTDQNLVMVEVPLSSIADLWGTIYSQRAELKALQRYFNLTQYPIEGIAEKIISQYEQQDKEQVD